MCIYVVFLCFLFEELFNFLFKDENILLLLVFIFDVLFVLVVLLMLRLLFLFFCLDDFICIGGENVNWCFERIRWKDFFFIKGMLLVLVGGVKV